MDMQWVVFCITAYKSMTYSIQARILPWEEKSDLSLPFELRILYKSFIGSSGMGEVLGADIIGVESETMR